MSHPSRNADPIRLDDPQAQIPLSIVIFFALLIGAVAIVPGASNFVLLFLYVGIHDSWFPETISWDAKNAWLKCPGAIAHPRQWPPAPDQACSAMELCLAEGALSDAEIESLNRQIRMTPRCEKPE
jgi:hypothetical protein